MERPQCHLVDRACKALAAFLLREGCRGDLVGGLRVLVCLDVGNLVWRWYKNPKPELRGRLLKLELVDDLEMLWVYGVREHDRNVFLNCICGSVPKIGNE